MVQIELPAPLIEQMRTGRVVLFLGAGASLEAKADDGSKPPTAPKLAQILAEKFLGEDVKGVDLMQVAEMAQRAAGKNNVSAFLRNFFRAFKPSPAHLLLPQFQWQAIATTNYDVLVEDAYGKAQQPIQNLVTFVKDQEPVEQLCSAVERPIKYLKLHGCVDHAFDSDISLVLDPASYERYAENRTNLFARLSMLAEEFPFVFVGYGIGDTHIRNMIYRLNKDKRRPEFYIVTPGVPQTVAQHWASERVTVINAKFGAFMKAVDRQVLPMWRGLQPGLLRADMPLRRHFRTNSDPSERLISSLDKDLCHVHGGMSVPELKAKDFFRGLEDGFSAIASAYDVRRRVTNDMLVDLIDDQEGGDVKFKLLRGVAGSGKTIALKRLAWEVAQDFDEPVFWLQANGRLKPEVLRELNDIIGKRLYVFIDGAAGHLEDMRDALREAISKHIPLTIVGAERDTVWNTQSDDFDERWATTAMTIDRLAQNEIDELLEKLREHKALGVLASLSKEEQVEALKEADRHLLVALHEVTQGKRFEDIVVDECETLQPFKARQLYLDICTLNQFGAPARAGVMNRISAIPFSMYRKEFFAPLQGVVVTQKNPYSGDNEYKARHRRVASMVFKGVFDDDGARVDQLVRIAEALDIGYRADEMALTQIIKARNLITILGKADFGRRLYDEVGRHLGHPWYVWQQRAIFEMHIDNGSLENAEECIKNALQKESKRDAIIHTYAEISRLKALRAPNDVQRDVYWRQSWERLRDIKHDTSSYADGTRCKLRLDQLRDIIRAGNLEDNNNAAAFGEASRNARITIDNATARHPDDPEITRLKADWFDLMKDAPNAIRAMEKAVRLGSKGSGVSLQLARMHREQGDLEKEMKVLQAALDKAPHDPSVNLAIAKAYLRANKGFDRAGYFLARSYGGADRDYAARYLHAQYLLANSEGDRASELFDTVNRTAPAEFLVKSNHERTAISDRLGRLTGRIVKKEETYAFVQCPGYPRNIYASVYESSEKDWSEIRHQATVTFEIGFNRMGPVALELKA